jgi:hypothetical protein
MTAKTRAIPSLHHDHFLAKEPGRWSVLASGNTTSLYCRAVRLHPEPSTMIKKLFISLLLIAISLVSASQTVEYQQKCRQFRRVYKVRCALLILNADKTFLYKETATDLPNNEHGWYTIKADTIILNTENYGTIKYLKENKSLIIQSPSYFMPKKLKIIKNKKAKA